MNLAELVDEKTSVFERPKRIRGILEGKRRIEVNDFYEIAGALSNRKEKEAVVLEGFDIIPPEFYSYQNFSKRGKVVHLNTFRGNAKKLKEEEWSELKARIDASHKYDRRKGPYAGWVWIDPEKKHHVVRPSIVVEGHRIHHYSHTNPKIRNKIRIYSSKNSVSNTINVVVPSRSSERPHQVLLEHIPRIRNPERYVEWTRVSSRHDCDFKRNDFTFNYESRVERYCPHDVAAYVSYSRRAAEETRVIIPQIFPMFTEPFLRLFMGAAYHTIKIDEFKKNGTLRHKSRPLSFPEIDAILMDAWLLYGNKQTCFVRAPTKQYQTGQPIGKRKRMRDYNWSHNAPGLQFGDD